MYIKTFLQTGVPFGLMMVGLDVVSGDGFSVGKFLFLTCFFGLGMSIMGVTFQRYALEKLGIYKISEANLKVTQERSVSSTLSKAELIQRLKADPSIAKMDMVENENEIHLRTGFSWASWGEVIKIVEKHSLDDHFEYAVSSRPKLKTTLVDYGRNLENILKIEKVMKSVDIV